ncbi:hypothetical protein DH2020_003476 [Rehmannia glutinosa]|uniref:AAA+ ATPase domain-containing protein n=1 Tax=Rehmannia glutinosa TaxID=99300 RepID=A0ABR0XLP8_REHGL
MSPNWSPNLILHSHFFEQVQERLYMQGGRMAGGTEAIRLERTNYNFWKVQVLTTVRAHGFEDFLFGTSTPPAKYTFLWTWTSLCIILGVSCVIEIGALQTGRPVCSQFREEPQLIYSLVRRIETELRNSPVVVAPYIVGLDFPMEELMELLDITNNAPKVIGLLGPGGIGKTTISSALYNKLGKHFERRSFLPNARETFARADGLLSLQNRLIKDLSVGSVRPIENENAGTAEIKRKLQENRVLVVIDDIDDATQLAELAFHREWLSEGSRIIINTRNRNALPSDLVDEIYQVRQLSSSDSLKLFSYYALRREKPTEPFLELSKKIVSITGGLPLALQVFGSLLYDKRRVEEWRDALEKLKEIRPDNLQDILKISFDALDSEVRTMFLDIACLLLDLEMKREDVIDVMRGCGFKAEIGLTTLVARSLVRVIEEDRLWMHDQIRDMGRQIVFDEAHSDIGSRSRVWDPRHVRELLQDQKGTRNVEGIVLDFEVKNRQRIISAQTIAWNQLQTAPNLAAALTYTKGKFKKHFLSNTEEEEEGEVRFATKSFESMINLRLLHFNNVKLEGNFTCIPNAVRWLQWHKCPLKSLPPDFHPTELRVLDLSQSKIERVWEPKWFWTNQQVTNKLMVLNLRNCYNITTIPDLSGHKCLEKLILERCSSLTSIHKSVGDLNTLRHLNLTDCCQLAELPNDASGLKNLELLLLSGCSQLKKLPHNVDLMTSLRELLLDGTAVEELPETIFRLTKLERLTLDRCVSIKRLPQSIGKLSALRELSLLSSALEELPNSIGSLGNLETLNLMWCKSLSEIPKSIGNLKSLADLGLSGSSVRLLPESVGSLYYLRRLSAGNCSSLRALPVSIEGLSSVVELDLSNTAITGLPDEIGFMKSLKKLELIGCKELSSLPKTIGNLLALHTLNLTKSFITELPESIETLENLVVLRMNHCEKLTKLPESFGNLTNLRHLLMEHTAVTELPESFGNLSNLIVLRMAKKASHGLIVENFNSQRKLVLPFSFSKLSLLEELNARAWRISGKIPDDFEKLSSLKILDLSYNDICSLPSDLRGLSVLEKLLLSHCTELKALPPLPTSLMELDAANCVSLENLSDFSNLVSLQEMHFTNCRKVFDITGVENLKCLKRLHMSGCSSRASAVIRNLDKVALRNLNSLSIPGSEIPDWFTRDEVCFSKRKHHQVKSVIIAVIISINPQVPDNSRLTLPVIADVEAKILRLNKPVFSTALDLKGASSTEEDQLYLCRYPQCHPLVSILDDGDKIKVIRRDPPFDEGVVLKRCGICVVYENDDDYDGEEDGLDESLQTVSQRLTTFIGPSKKKSNRISSTRTAGSEYMSADPLSLILITIDTTLDPRALDCAYKRALSKP